MCVLSAKIPPDRGSSSRARRCGIECRGRLGDSDRLSVSHRWARIWRAHECGRFPDAVDPRVRGILVLCGQGLALADVAQGLNERPARLSPSGRGRRFGDVRPFYLHWDSYQLFAGCAV